MLNVYDELKVLIDHIQSVYTTVTDDWIDDHQKVNLKRTQIVEISNDSVVYRNITKYIQLLNTKYPELILPLSECCSYPVTSRVKTQNSIEDKIQRYRTSQHENGKIPIKKCLNDLLGIRVAIEPSLTFNDIRDFLERSYSGKYRCIDSSKDIYKAVHLYFQADNFSFPWELQIWNQLDFRANIESHNRYKQAYTTWERESKEGGITNG